MNCERIQLELESYARDLLDEAMARSVRAHLDGCSSCRSELAALEPLVSALEDLPGPAVDADALADRVLSKSRRSPPPSGPPRLLAFVLALGFVALAVALTFRSPAPVQDPPLDSGSSGRSSPTTPRSGTREPDPVPAPPLDSGSSARSSPTPPRSGTREPDPVPVPVPAPVPAPPPAPAPAPAPVPVPVPAPAPPPEQLTQTPAPRRIVGVVAIARGVARKRPPGSTLSEWNALNPGSELRAGDAMVAGGGLELVLAGGDDRLIFAAAARATLAPSESTTARVDGGELFASCSAKLSLLVGPATVTLEGSDAVVALEESGGVAVSALAGHVRIEAGAARVELAPNERVLLDKSGKAGKPTKAEAPKWLAAHSAIEASRLVLSFTAATTDAKAPSLLVGLRKDGVLRGSTIEKKGPNTKIVCIGRGDASGIAAHETGLRLRVRYRVSRSVPLGIQVTDLTQSRNFQSVIEKPRAVEWTTLELDLDSFADEARSDKKLAAGDRLDILTLSAHGDVAFEVSEIVLFRAR